MPRKRDDDPLLTYAECAELIGVAPGTYRGYVSTGDAPAPDDPDDADGKPANRRQPRTRRSRVIAWNKDRPGRGRWREPGTP